MDSLHKGVIALVVMVGSAMAAVPASADGGYAAPGSDRPYYPSIWRGLYAGVHLGHDGQATETFPIWQHLRERARAQLILDVTCQ